ncbi:hypothetical protein GCK32_018067 [Trichostrongylus colubriformis]|uniref:Uncharacterized protein n=1 Tax=Trichostrongylus colubriformis TaxID=6319 RepID=A0AAN8FKK6_TRICO
MHFGKIKILFSEGEYTDIHLAMNAFPMCWIPRFVRNRSQPHGCIDIDQTA